MAVPLRHPMLAADAMATVQGVSGGRASFSLARGDGAMKVLQRKPMPVAQFEAYVRQVQGFLRGDDVEMDGAVASMARLGTIDPSLDVPKPSVNVAATGPRMITMAARYADGVSFAVGADIERLAQCRDLVLARSVRPTGAIPGRSCSARTSSSRSATARPTAPAPAT